ncbi:MAG: cell wall-binding repeat-containing protein, partial [Actinobacteria bacterium]|nr:cell wall-binding repeat-containing protein [Actinomycetota bacterium]
AEAAHPWGAETVFLAEGLATADVLSIGPAADRVDGAVLLAKPTSLPTATRERLEALDPERIVVVGGTARIKDSLLSDLRKEGYQVSRVSGATRYETAAQIAEAWPDTDTLYISSGTIPAATLPAGAAAAHVGAPMLLTSNSRLSQGAKDELARLTPGRVVMVGGQDYVSTAVAHEIRAILPSARMHRIAGQDVYGTSILLARDAWSSSGSAVLVNAGKVVDGVAGTQLAAYQDAPLVLTRYSCQTPSVRQGLAALRTDLHTVLGGSAVIDLRAGTNGG